MGFLGDLISLHVKIANAPLEAVERLFNDGERVDGEDRFLSAPLKALSDTLSDIDN
jgi:hypothetical protein